MLNSLPFTGQTPIAEAGRAIFAAQLAIFTGHAPNLSSETSETAVHESRKAIRRTFTGFKTFGHYYQPEIITAYRRGLKKIMRRLGRCRDTDVFLATLIADNAALADDSLAELIPYWQDQQTVARVMVRSHLARPKTVNLLHNYAAFTQQAGAGSLPPEPDAIVPEQTRHIAPVLIFTRLAGVMAFEPHLADATLPQMHQLRVQFKELRYTLEFFQSIFAVDMSPTLAHLNAIQDQLGALNDAHIAQQMLAQTPGRETAVAHYQAMQSDRIHSLRTGFAPLWQDFLNPAWRQALAAAVATL